jgi:S1-C subfamily serine protease
MEACRDPQQAKVPKDKLSFGFLQRVRPGLPQFGLPARPQAAGFVQDVQVAPEQVAKQLGLKGVLILGVQPDSPAARARLRGTRRDDSGRIQVGDVITAIDGEKVESVNQLLDRLEKYKAGSSVEVTFSRDGKEEKVNVKLEALQ